jgi:hypothetical protein
MNATAFLDNLHYMGEGMLGIGIVIGIMVLTILILNKATSFKRK